MDKYFYDKKVEVILTELKNSLFDIVKTHGAIKLFDRDKYRLTVGSFKDAVATELYIENNVLMLKCSYWENYYIPMNCDFHKSYCNVGEMSYEDYLNIYKLVIEIIND